MTADTLDRNLSELKALLLRYAGSSTSKSPMGNTLCQMARVVDSARERITQLETAPEKLTARDEVALRMLAYASADLEATSRMIEAYQLADIFLEVRHQTLAKEF